MTRMKYCAWHLFFVLGFLFCIHSPAQAANTFTVALDGTNPNDTFVTMRETTDQLAFKVTNTGTSAAINSVKFLFTSATYKTTTLSSIPSGWSATVNNTEGESSITFTTTGGGITIGNSLTFPITLKGNGDEEEEDVGIPTAANNATDTLSSTVVKSGSTTFTLSSSLPSWTRHGMKITSFTASPTSIGIGENANYALNVTNVSSANHINIVPGTMASSGTGSLNAVSGPTPASLNLNANVSGSYAYVYSGATGGTVTLSNTVGNGSITAPSFNAQTVTVATLGAVIAVDSTTITSGYNVGVTMTISNGGGSTITNVIPGTMTLGGTATKTLISGPLPTSVASLLAGHKVNFVWSYMITGTAGQTYTFTNNATADGGQASASVTTSTGSIGSVFATVSPSYLGKGATNTVLGFQCFNATGLTVKAIRVRAANTSFVASSGSSSEPIYNAWSTAISGTDVTFTSPGTGSNVPNGSNVKFNVTYSSLPAPSSDTSYPFDIQCTKSDSTTASFSPVPFSVTLDQITMSKSPNKNLVSKFNDTVTITATVTNSGSPVNAVTVTFSTTDGKLSSTSVTTNSSGQASTTLTAPNTPTDIESTVTATINSAVETITVYIDGTNAESSSTVREKY